MLPSDAFSSVIASVLASTPPDAGSPEAAFAAIAGAPLAGPKAPLLPADQRRFVQAYVLPPLLVLIAQAEIGRVVEEGPFKDQPYYAPDKTDGKQVGVEILASRYYHNNGYPDMPIRTYGASGGPYYHCAEFVWNSAILAGFHVPMNRNPKVANYYGFLNSANVLFDQCDAPNGVADLAAPKPEDSFKAMNVFKDVNGNSVGLPGPRVGDVIVGRRDLNAEGKRHPGHVALLRDPQTTPPTWLEAGSAVRSDAKHELTTRGIGDDHDTRLVRLRNPDWARIERWLAEGSKAEDFGQYMVRYPAGVKENSYRGVFAAAVAQVSTDLAADESANAEEARTQLSRLQQILGISE